MIKNFLTALLLVFSQLAMAQNDFRVKGTAPESMNGKKIYLNIFDLYSDSQFRKRDSAIVKNGTFSFEGEIPKVAEFAQLSTKKGGFSFIVDSGSTEIIIKEEKESPNELNRSQAINSANNALYAKLEDIKSGYFRMYGQPIPNTRTGRSLPGEKQRELFKAQLDIIKEYPNSIVSLLQTYQIACMAPMQQNLEAPLDAYRSLTHDLQISPLGQEFYRKISKRFTGYASIKVGSPMPEFEINTFNETSFNNRQLAGKPYIVAFSATWCIPCQEELPTLKRMYDKYKNTGLEVVYFNFDDNEKKWAEHISKNKLTWINVSERTKMIASKIAQQFHIYAVPTTLLVDRSGRIIFNSEYEKDRMKALEGHLQKL